MQFSKASLHRKLCQLANDRKWLSRLKGVSFGKLDWTSLDLWCTICNKFSGCAVWNVFSKIQKSMSQILTCRFGMRIRTYIPDFERTLKDSYLCLRSQTTLEFERMFEDSYVCFRSQTHVPDFECILLKLNRSLRIHTLRIYPFLFGVGLGILW